MGEGLRRAFHAAKATQKKRCRTKLYPSAVPCEHVELHVGQPHRFVMPDGLVIERRYRSRVDAPDGEVTP